MKILKYISLAIVLLGSEQISLSQYYLKVKSSSTNLESDSSLLFIDGYRGTLNWQASSDLLNWVSLDKHKDTLGVRIDSSAYYRAAIVEENCNPVMSDTAFLNEKVTITGSDQFTVDIQGGVFLLPSGIKVKIPVGAVSGPKEIKVDILGFNDANALAPISNSENASFLSGISIATDQFDFKKPIKIKIPLLNIDVKSLPVLYELNNDSNTWLMSDETMIVIPKDKFIEIILNGSGQKSIAQVTKSESITQVTKSELSIDDPVDLIIKSNPNTLNLDDPCHAKGFTSKTGSYDYSNSGGCSVVHITNGIVYSDCASPQSYTDNSTQIAPSCQPQLIISPPGNLKIKLGEPQTITLTTQIAGLPLSDQNIIPRVFEILYGNLTVNIPDPTNLNGNTSLIVTGTQAGLVTIHLGDNFSYYLTQQHVSGNGVTENIDDGLVKPTLDATINVTVYDKPEVTTGSVTLISCASATVSGNVIADNYDPITQCGVYLGTSPNPEITGSYLDAEPGTGPFSITLLNLEPNTTYYVKSFARNLAGTSFGEEVPFTITKTTVTITSKDYTCSEATIGVNVISDDNVTVTERGLYYGPDPDPVSTGTKLPLGSGAGTFTGTITNLTPNIPYYVKPYAVTECGTILGDELIFTLDKICIFTGNYEISGPYGEGNYLNLTFSYYSPTQVSVWEPVDGNHNYNLYTIDFTSNTYSGNGSDNGSESGTIDPSTGNLEGIYTESNGMSYQVYYTKLKSP